MFIGDSGMFCRPTRVALCEVSDRRKTAPRPPLGSSWLLYLCDFFLFCHCAFGLGEVRLLRKSWKFCRRDSLKDPRENLLCFFVLTASRISNLAIKLKYREKSLGY